MRVLPLALALSLALASPASAACQYCGGHFTNMSCKDVNSTRTNGWEECKTNTTGQCVASGASCTYGGGSCTNKTECGPYHDVQLLLPQVQPGQTIILEAVPACRVPGFVIEA